MKTAIDEKTAVKTAIDETLEQIRLILHRYTWSEQPVYAAMMGDVSIEQVRAFTLQYSVFPLYNHNYHGRLYVICPDPVWRQDLAEIVYEEGTGNLYANGIAHNELWIQFGESIGLVREDMWNAELCPGTLALRVYFEWICGRSFLEGVSAHMLAGEAQVHGVYSRISKNLKKRFGLSDAALAFWDVHDIADVEHSGVGYKLLDKFARTDADHRLVLKTVRDYCGIEQLMNLDIHRLMQEAA